LDDDGAIIGAFVSMLAHLAIGGAVVILSIVAIIGSVSWRPRILSRIPVYFKSDEPVVL
jgi:hypothetical protein